MYEERLTQRIRNLERRNGRKGTGDVAQVVNSIINHLQRVLNTRQGSVPIAEDYGMPDFTNYQGLGLTEEAKDIADIIKNMILKYEPRLGGAQVTYEPDKDDLLSLRFKLQTEIVHVRDERIVVELETVISSEGKVRVTQ
ncbi:MAG: Gene 25-like lysozyme [Syntrophorhabdus sp. PtaB.Bin047]|jgi:type VI secretion system protein|nr:MAG: Gene 25-like lysozyme [Syntrophorhabdus sp. PtaB.Bin047]